MLAVILNHGPYSCFTR